MTLLAHAFVSCSHIQCIQFLGFSMDGFDDHLHDDIVFFLENSTLYISSSKNTDASPRRENTVASHNTYPSQFNDKCSHSVR